MSPDCSEDGLGSLAGVLFLELRGWVAMRKAESALVKKSKDTVETPGLRTTTLDRRMPAPRQKKGHLGISGVEPTVKPSVAGLDSIRHRCAGPQQHGYCSNIQRIAPHG